MTEPKPIYDGAIGDDGHTIMCKCGDFAAYMVVIYRQDQRYEVPVCNVDQRRLYRRGGYADCSVLPEYASFQVRMRVWDKRNG